MTSGQTLEIRQPPNVTRHPASSPSCTTTNTAQPSTRDGPPRGTGRTPKPTAAPQQKTEAVSPLTTQVNQVTRTLWTRGTRGTEPHPRARRAGRQPAVRKQDLWVIAGAVVPCPLRIRGKQAVDVKDIIATSTPKAIR